MKTLLTIITTTLLLAACNATSGDGMMRLGGCPAVKGGEAPSGCQVPGYAGYFFRPGSTEVVQVANPKTARHILRTNRDPNLGGM
jgi:hypothetical protein